MNIERRGFTLIELVAVVGVMILSLSFLMPSYSITRRRAQSSVCMSNLRQLAHGWHMYADANNDVALPGRFGNEQGGTSNPNNWYDVGNGSKYRPRWVATMGTHVGIFAFNQPSTEDDRQDYDSRVYACPTVADRIDERNYAYGYNHQFLGNARKTNGRFHNFPVPRTRIRSFAGTVLAADSMGTAAGLSIDERQPYDNGGTDDAQVGNHAWTLDPPRLTATSDHGTGESNSPRTAVDPRHAGQANLVFCDGHAETLDPYDVGYRLLPDGAYVDLESVDDPPSNRFFSGSGWDDDPPDLPQ